MPRDTPGRKAHKTPPMTELVEDPQPTLTSSEYIRRWQEQSNRLGRHNATYRRTKAEPPKGDA